MTRRELAFVIALALLSVLAMAQMALSYPENVRLGYTSCASCHVSPTGGGVLTNYGRSSAEELSSFAREGDGDLLGKLHLPDRVAVGGDARYVSFRAGQYDRHFPMQSDAEVAVHPTDEVWIAASAGMYGEQRATEIRRNYVYWTPSPAASLRLGKFYPAYGIMVPDHTIATRAGLGYGQGQETYNAEVSWHGRRGDLTLTPTWGVDERVRLGSTTGYRWTTGDTGGTARATWYLGDRSLVGASGKYRRAHGVDTMAYGGYLSAGLTRDLYVLSETDYQADSDHARKLVSYTEVGWEVARGFHPQLTHEADHEYGTTTSHKLGVALQWLPLVHWELYTRAQYEVIPHVWAYTLLGHYYW